VPKIQDGSEQVPLTKRQVESAVMWGILKAIGVLFLCAFVFTLVLTAINLYRENA
jgi:hypothetical protein